MARDIPVSQEGSSAPPEDSHDGSDAGSGQAASGLDEGGGASKKRKTVPKPIAKACNECARRKARVSAISRTLSTLLTPSFSVLGACHAPLVSRTVLFANTLQLNDGEKALEDVQAATRLTCLLI